MERIKHLDNLKAFAIFLVIYGHVLSIYAYDKYESTACIVIYSFHMALFMSLSGYFFKSAEKKSFKEVLKSKSLQLLVPLVAWTAITAAVRATATLDTEEGLEIIKKYIYSGGPIHGLWYLKAIFILYIANYLALKALKNDYAAAIATSAVFIILPDMNFTSIMCPFFWLGYFIRKHHDILTSNAAVITAAIIIAAIMALTWECGYSYNFKDNSPAVYLQRFVIGAAYCIVLFRASELISPLTERLDKKGMIAKAGTYTLGIYCIHAMFYMEDIWGWIHTITGNEICLAAWSLIILIICSIIVALMRKCKAGRLLTGQTSKPKETEEKA